MSKWKTLSGEIVPDLVQAVRLSTSHGQVVHVGTDSLQVSRWTQFVTVVVILTVREDGRGGGGKVFYRREIVPRMSALRERLLKEAWESVQVAMQLNIDNLTIHLDANPDTKYMSSKYLKELVGLVVGCGFKVLYKPESWASTTVADWVVRHKGRMTHEVKEGGFR